jgi:hypothetical protein
MMSIPNTKRIPTEGRCTKPRNKRIIVIEVEHEIAMTLEGTYLKAWVIPGTSSCERMTSRLEIYEDRLGFVLDTCLRTEAHKEAWRRAEEMCAFNVAEWQRERTGAMRGMTDREREQYTAEHCDLHPVQYLKGLGHRTGIPNLLSVKVVSQRDEEKTVDAADFLTMPNDDRAEYLGAAPPTSANAADRSAEMMADVLRRAFANKGAPTKAPRK